MQILPRPRRHTTTLAACLGSLVSVCAAAGCGEAPKPAPIEGVAVSEVVIEPGPEVSRPPFSFAADDEALLDEIQRGAFNYLWHAGNPETGMVPDRSSKPVVSVAGVGYQLGAIPIAIERGWITREAGEERTLRILRALANNPANRKAGLFYHFVNGQDAGQPDEAYEHVVSTIDSAILFGGVLTASSYFGGEVAAVGDRLFEDADWRFFELKNQSDPVLNGYLSLAWKPESIEQPSGEGELMPFAWIDAGDEHRLVTFLAACAPTEAHRVDPNLYYRLRRGLGEYKDAGTMVWFPWSGALFTAFFAHCWIDYSALGTDNPLARGIENRPRVDWWENSRRLTRLHQIKCLENPKGLATFNENAWGLSASDTATGYGVPGVFPNAAPMLGAIPEIDYPTYTPTDDYGDGTLAPYTAGCTIMFDPQRAVAALRYYRSLAADGTLPELWNDPGEGVSSGGGYGFQDSYNLGTRWVAPDVVAIDQGPLIIAIEYARTGLVWDLFHKHRFVQQGLERLGLERTRAGAR